MADKSTRSKRYSEEFRLQAAKLIDWALRCWVKAFRASGHLPPKGQVVPLAEELKAARRELAQLRQENEILKKAAAYFAKESL